MHGQLVIAIVAVVIPAVGIAPVIVVRIAAVVIAVVIAPVTAVATVVIVIAIPRVGFGGGAQGHEDRGNAQEEGLSQHFGLLGVREFVSVCPPSLLDPVAMPATGGFLSLVVRRTGFVI
jgi:hypothetical protein